VLVAAAPTRAQLRAAAVALAAAVLAAAASAAFPGVASLEGGERTRDGAIALALLIGIAAVAELVTMRSRPPQGALRWSRRLGRVGAVVLAAAAIGLVAGGLGERPTDAQLAAGATAGRLTTTTSYRYEYWRVALRELGREPLRGLGAGGFRVAWLKQRPVAEAVRDTHSIELEMVAELGLVGLLAFAIMVGGAVVSGRDALRREPEVVAGMCAATVVWVLHASIDWDWQLPAVTLPALVLAAGLLAESERRLPGTAPADWVEARSRGTEQVTLAASPLETVPRG
jgi:O-antigen ligase